MKTAKSRQAKVKTNRHAKKSKKPVLQAKKKSRGYSARKTNNAPIGLQAF